MNQRTRVLGRTIGAVLLALLGMSRSGAVTPPGAVRIGEPLRPAMIRGLNGPARRLSSYAGKPLLINVWASWCGPCRAEMASLERLAWLEPARHFNIIGISTDDDPEQARGWLARSNATISQFIDTDLEMEHMLGAERLPLTVLVGADGRVIERIYGAREWDGAQSLQLIRRAFGLRGP